MSVSAMKATQVVPRCCKTMVASLRLVHRAPPRLHFPRMMRQVYILNSVYTCDITSLCQDVAGESLEGANVVEEKNHEKQAAYITILQDRIL